LIQLQFRSEAALLALCKLVELFFRICNVTISVLKTKAENHHGLKLVVAFKPFNSIPGETGETNNNMLCSRRGSSRNSRVLGLQQLHGLVERWSIFPKRRVNGWVS
jgi:hypothetical protein